MYPEHNFKSIHEYMESRTQNAFILQHFSFWIPQASGIDCSASPLNENVNIQISKSLHFKISKWHTTTTTNNNNNNNNDNYNNPKSVLENETQKLLWDFAIKWTSLSWSKNQ